VACHSLAIDDRPSHRIGAPELEGLGLSRGAEGPYSRVGTGVHPGAMARAELNVDAGAPSVSPQARRSLQLLWWIPLSPIVGFLLGSLILSESWPLWQVIPLVLVLAAPFAVGALYGYSAIRRHDRTGWVGLVLHSVMTVVAIVMPISESISG
jgi:hypothetical protein